jgi:hypothetical protein
VKERREMSVWHRSLILGAVLSLTVSVATRYSTVVQQEAAAKIVTSQSLDAKRQHLLNDGLHWSAPAVAFVLFVPAGASAVVLPAVPPIPRLYSEDLLYSRPPPSC